MSNVVTITKKDNIEDLFLDFDTILENIKKEQMTEDEIIISRWYQETSVAKAISFIAQGYKRILINLPTGAGKTHTSRLLFKSQTLHTVLGVKDRPLRLLFVTHKKRLSTQAERVYDPESNIIFIKQSAYSPVPQDVIDEGWDVTCVDEAHHEAMYSFQILLDTIKEKPLIGLTATPERADGLLLKFEKVVCEISRKQAVEEGYLAETYLNSIVDAGGVNKESIIKETLNNYAQEMGQTIIFVRTKKEVKAINDHLVSNGYNSLALLEQSDSELDTILDDFSAGKYQFIVNCQKINEGVDVKNCNTIFLARQYKSYPEINQAIGRAARPDSDCHVWQLINPIKNNLDTTNIVGKPKEHRLISFKPDHYVERFFDSNKKNNILFYQRMSKNTPSIEAKHLGLGGR
jgi:superfamily II DNA or RNA helicase